MNKRSGRNKQHNTQDNIKMMQHHSKFETIPQKRKKKEKIREKSGFQQY